MESRYDSRRGPRRAVPKDPMQALSKRQLQVLQRVAEGDTTGQIAADLSLSSKTVDQHIGNATRRLGARNRSAAVAQAVARGLVRISTPK